MMTKWWTLIVVLVLTTVALQPWRDAISQDDAAYAYSAISKAKGNGELHVGNVAAIFPQLFLGTVVLKALSNPPSFSVLSGLTWVCFLFLIFLTIYFLKISPVFVGSFFLFPIWVQYGSSYLTETYSALCLVGLMFSLHRILEKGWGWWRGVLVFLLSLLLGLQIQNMAAFPFFWGLLLVLRSSKEQKRVGFLLMAGGIFSALGFLGMEKTPFQQGYGYWLAQSWVEKGFSGVFEYLSLLIQLVFGLGIFLIPLISIKNLTLRQIGLGLTANVVFVGLIPFLGLEPFSAGVFFTNYLPTWVGLLFVSLGVWGWVGVNQAWRTVSREPDFEQGVSLIPLEGTILTFGVILLFTAFRTATDIRYVMTWGLPILYHLRNGIRDERGVLGTQIPYFGLVAIVAIFLNTYSLNTSEARWTVARNLEVEGVPSSEIAAGVGRDAFMLEHDCVKKIIPYLEKTESHPVWKSKEFYTRIISRYSRSYSDGWVPRYVIKPSKAFGKSLDLKKNRLPGQDGDPVDYYDYSVFGLKNQLAIFKNENYTPSWCSQL